MKSLSPASMLFPNQRLLKQAKAGPPPNSHEYVFAYLERAEASLPILFVSFLPVVFFVAFEIPFEISIRVVWADAIKAIRA